MAFGVNTTVTEDGLGVIARRQCDGESQDEAKYLAIGTGATGADRTAAAGDTALSTEIESRVGDNGSTAETTTLTDDTQQNINTIPITGTHAVDEIGLFDASSSGNLVVSSTVNEINVVSGDSIQVTHKVVFS